MGNTQTSYLFALAAPNAADEVKHQSSNPPYSISTGADYVSTLSMLASLDKFKIIPVGYKSFDIQNACKQTLLSARSVKRRNTKGHAVRKAYDLTIAGAIVLVALEYENLQFQPNTSHLGYIHFHYKGIYDINVEIYDNTGNKIITTSTENRIHSMIYLDGQCFGSFQKRNSESGTKGQVLQHLDVRFKACILFAAVLACRYCHYYQDHHHHQLNNGHYNHAQHYHIHHIHRF
ncbi:hypothetical protein HOLleu_02003 [Holothuria leucospilota]|uniref:Uncharacterized protein n=1 Tax=Holothuria leucospilota TaxID=206669 RepID=A0A9Q1CQP2_HOLLE|nr:hypothetical protein HOLleu_02003 [Holothuria leucospilota]